MDTPDSSALNPDTPPRRAPIVTINRRPTSFRVWDGQHQIMYYPWSDKHFFPYGVGFSGTYPPFAMQIEGELARWSWDSVLSPLVHPLNVQILPLQDTGLCAEGNPDRHIYEGDIISFIIRGATHGREEHICSAAHVWWSTKDACWAFGRWTQPHQMWNGKEWTTTGSFDWWYTAQDDGFDHSSLKILGNLFENPELIPTLGYSNPSL